MRKKIRVEIDNEAYQRFRALLKNDPDLSGAMKTLGVKLINKPSADFEIVFEINGMMTYDLWDKLCRTFNQRMPFPG